MGATHDKRLRVGIGNYANTETTAELTYITLKLRSKRRILNIVD
jgi:hypothetical protein